MKFVDRLRRTPPDPPHQQFWKWLSLHPDPMGALISLKAGELKYQMPVGLSAGGWRHTDAQTSLLALGPPRSTGKTAGIIIPTVLMQGGPVVTTSSKFDVARATALARSRLGTVWHFDPTGGPCPDGFKELRYSPIQGAQDWNVALETARQMMAASHTESSSQGSQASEVTHHFRERGGDLLATVLHYAARKGYEMDFVVERITAMNLADEFKPMVEDLRAMDSVQAGRLLEGLIYTEARERSAVFATVTVALRGYQGDALHSAKSPNFDPAAFVVGEPDKASDLFTEPHDDIPMSHLLAQSGLYPRLTGRYDTVYVTIPAEKQRMYAPILIGLLSSIRRAAYTVNRYDVMNGWHGRQPVTFVLDEMYGAPLPDLPEMLAEGGGQGLQIVGALQDMSQAVARWGEAGKGFLTLWQNVVVMPGIRHGETLELLSMLIGDYDRIVPTAGQAQTLGPLPFGMQRRIWMASESESIQRQRKVPPDEIGRVNPERPNDVLVFTPNGGWQHVKLMRYFAGDPWPSILMQSAEWSLKGPKRNRVLPLPDLARGGDTRYLHAIAGQPMVDWWHEIESNHASSNDISVINRTIVA